MAGKTVPSIKNHRTFICPPVPINIIIQKTIHGTVGRSPPTCFACSSGCVGMLIPLTADFRFLPEAIPRGWPSLRSNNPGAFQAEGKGTVRETSTNGRYFIYLI
uniref:Uncharacterized protein n=1 Tax=Sphaerodactylus townsendi TaxID=933632 RepID=A0ACB8EVJ5_9SAUR